MLKHNARRTTHDGRRTTDDAHHTMTGQGPVARGHLSDSGDQTNWWFINKA